MSSLNCLCIRKANFCAISKGIYFKNWQTFRVQYAISFRAYLFLLLYIVTDHNKDESVLTIRKGIRFIRFSPFFYSIKDFFQFIGLVYVLFYYTRKLFDIFRFACAIIELNFSLFNLFDCQHVYNAFVKKSRLIQFQNNFQECYRFYFNVETSHIIAVFILNFFVFMNKLLSVLPMINVKNNFSQKLLTQYYP